MTDTQLIWEEAGVQQTACWASLHDVASPRRILPADDTLPADEAYRLLCEGTSLLWRGDYHNARQLMQALARRIERRQSRRGKPQTEPVQAFHAMRKQQAERAHILAGLLLPVNADFSIPLRRAPDARAAMSEAYADKAPGADFVLPLRDLLGMIGAHEWRRKGIPLVGLPKPLYPHYGVFAPTRAEYLDLVQEAPLPAALDTMPMAFDVGTGTGVLALLLAQRGVAHVLATDTQSRALSCARENIVNMDLSARIDVLEANLFPSGKAALIVCNPPWLPVKPVSMLDAAVYDADSRMLNGFIDGLREHLAEKGEGWLILSDLAEHLGLRKREDLLMRFEKAGLRVCGRHETRPRHGKALRGGDVVQTARQKEIVTLWRLAAC